LKRMGIAVLVFAALVAFAVTGDVKGWFDTPLHLGTGESQSQSERIERLAPKARQSCRFGGALVRAQVREGRNVRAQEMANSFVGAIAGLDGRQREIVRKACLKGLELSLH
jgi:hypothetical protein